MTDNPSVRLHRMGQSVWYDHIRRGVLESGELLRMVRANEVRGVTSTPTIFENAIAPTEECHSALCALSEKRYSAEQAYEVLALEDIRAAADVFLPVFEESRGADGFISLEVSPALAADPDATLREAKRLSLAVNRPNLMVKIPGARACLGAIPPGDRGRDPGECHAAVFREPLPRGDGSLCRRIGRPRGARVAAGPRMLRCIFLCFAAGHKHRSPAGSDGRRLPLESGAAAGSPRKGGHCQYAPGLPGIPGVSREPKVVFLPCRRLGRGFRGRCGRPQAPRILSYPDTFYVEALIAPESVNTMPPATLAAYRDHGDPAIRIGDDLEGARALPGRLAEIGISLDQVTD